MCEKKTVPAYVTFLSGMLAGILVFMLLLVFAPDAKSSENVMIIPVNGRDCEKALKKGNTAKCELAIPDGWAIKEVVASSFQMVYLVLTNEQGLKWEITKKE